MGRISQPPESAERWFTWVHVNASAGSTDLMVTLDLITSWIVPSFLLLAGNEANEQASFWLEENDRADATRGAPFLPDSSIAMRSRLLEKDYCSVCSNLVYAFRFFFVLLINNFYRSLKEASDNVYIPSSFLLPFVGITIAVLGWVTWDFGTLSARRAILNIRRVHAGAWGINSGPSDRYLSGDLFHASGPWCRKLSTDHVDYTQKKGVDRLWLKLKDESLVGRFASCYY
jgi:hypothetical protein